MSVPAITNIGSLGVPKLDVALSCHFCGKKNVTTSIIGLEPEYPACQADACQDARRMAVRMDPSYFVDALYPVASLRPHFAVKVTG